MSKVLLLFDYVVHPHRTETVHRSINESDIPFRFTSFLQTESSLLKKMISRSWILWMILVIIGIAHITTSVNGNGFPRHQTRPSRFLFFDHFRKRLSIGIQLRNLLFQVYKEDSLVHYKRYVAIFYSFNFIIQHFSDHFSSNREMGMVMSMFIYVDHAK